MKKFVKIAVIIFGVVFLFAIIGTSFSDEEIQKEMDKTSITIAEDAIKQFNIAYRTENYMDAYTQASFIAISYLDAKDTENYKKWKEIEKALGKKIGL
jgi:hypothetical protein